MINLYWKEQLKSNDVQRPWMRNYKIAAHVTDLNFTVQCRKTPKKPWWSITTFVQHNLIHNFSLAKGERLTDKKFNEIMNQKMEEEPVILLALFDSIFRQ